jgi:hypothetical protein
MLKFEKAQNILDVFMKYAILRYFRLGSDWVGFEVK